MYGERGRGGGEQRETGTKRNSTRDQECQQQPPGLKIKGRNPDCRSNPDAEKNTFARDTC